jgi:hypothetical protein
MLQATVYTFAQMKKSLFGVLFLVILSIPSLGQELAPTQQKFGQNRIQKKKFDWQILSSNNFEVYFYSKSESQAKQLLEYAEAEYERMNALLGYAPFGRTKIFFYNSTTELFQSNTNLELTTVVNELNSKLSNNKIEIAYPGDNVLLREHFSEKLANIFLYEMIYGGNLKDLVQSSVLMNLPEWFMEGCIAYTASPWSAADADYMRDAAIKKELVRPESLNGETAKRIGKSVWHYIAETNGKESISNILNITRIVRNNQTGIASTLGTTYNKFLRNWKAYYTTSSAANTNYGIMRMDNKITLKDTKQNLLTARQSTSGNFTVYSTEEKGQYKVFVLNNKTKLEKQLIKVGTKSILKTNTTTEPLFSWAQADVLAVVFEDGDKIRLQLYKDFSPKNPKGRLSLDKTIRTVEEITALNLSSDAKQMVFSAVKNNQNDLFEYEFSRGGITQLTNDKFDDRNPQYVPNGQGSIMYLSNRTEADSTNKNQYSLKNVNKSFNIVWHSGIPKEANLKILADSLGSVSGLTPINDSTALFLSDEKGVNNLYRFAKGDTTYVSINQITNSSQNIYDYQVTSSGTLLFKTMDNKKGTIGIGRRLDLENNYELPPLYNKTNAQAANSALFPKLSIVEEETENEETIQSNIPNLEPNEIDTDFYKFDNLNPTKQTKEGSKKNSVIIKSSARKESKQKEVVKFKDKITLVGMDNNFVSDPLRGFGWKPTAVWSDLLQNQVIEGGLMITPILSSYDINGEYTNYTKKIDWGVKVERRVVGVGDAAEYSWLYNSSYNKLSVKVSYPLSVKSRFTLSPFYMNSATNARDNLTEPPKSTFRGYNLEYVYDNTANLGMNQIEGTRLKARIENIRGIADEFDSFQKITLDARNYTKLPIGITLASRLSVGRYFGLAPKNFKLGGVDNQIYNSVGPINAERGFANGTFEKEDRHNLLFSDYVTNLRGFNSNSVAGQNHIVGNIEFRLPLNSYLKTQNSSLGILNNLQGTIFSDVATAWNKRNPFATENDINTSAINGSGSFSGEVTDFKSPIIGSYGFGFRSTLFGYFVKADLAWGIEDLKVGEKMLHISFGYDF